MKKFVTVFCVIVFVLGLAATGSAAANITFEATNVFFENDGKLTVEGVFSNNGSHDGTVTYSKVTVLKGHGDSAVPIAVCDNFGGAGAFVPSNGKTIWRYGISGVQYTDLTAWRVQTHLKFRW